MEENVVNLRGTSDLIEQEFDDEEDDGALVILFENRLIELKDFEPLGFEPPIDEPITGSGNEDLWEQNSPAAPPGDDDEQ